MKMIFPPPAALPSVMLFLAVYTSTTTFVCSQARLVKDLNTIESRHRNEYSQLTHAGEVFYFVSHGKELWKSDGTPSGTRRVKAVRGIQNLTLMGNVLYFGATDRSAAELWKSDGTYSGTVRVKQIRKGTNIGTPKSFTSFKGIVFFVADNGTGYELWKTDGTLWGTVLVKDIQAGAEGSEPAYLTVMNDMLYFSADDGINGRELWKSDGTAAGTVMVKDIETEEGQSSDPMELVTMNDFLFFSANHSLSGRELWRSDGTTNRTLRLKDVNPGAASAQIGSIRKMGNAIYFNAKSETTGTALWRSSGTTAGTVKVKDLTPDGSEYEVFDMTVLNNRIYWLLSTSSGYEVWVSNGTAAGTRVATTFENRDTPARFIYMNNKVYFFSAYETQDPHAPFQQLSSIDPDGSDWREIWKMERPYTVGGEEDEFWYGFSMDIVAFDNSLFFPGVINEVEGYKLLKSNGTGKPPEIVVDTYRATQSSVLGAMVKTDTYVYFSQDRGWESLLWRTDGTRDGTVLLKLSPGIGNPVSVGNTAYFLARGDDFGLELWKTDGSVTGTTLLRSFSNNYYLQLVDVGGTLFIYNDAGEVWRSDGTPTGTILLKKFSAIEHFAASGRVAYILVRTASGGQELWKSDGMHTGTVKVRTIRWTAGAWTYHNTSSTLNDVFYFVADNGTHGRELWRSDGTASGTYMVKDIRTGDNDDPTNDIWRITAFNNSLYINAMDVSGQLVLFRSDGTRMGTHKIYDSQQISKFMPFGDQLLFVAGTYWAPSLFSTDGTTAGTALIKRLPFGVEVSHVGMNGLIYFSHLGSGTLWRTDGTECGTVALPLGVTKIDNLIAANSDLLLFSAHHDLYGEELFSVNVNNLPVPSCPEVFAAIQGASTPFANDPQAEAISYGPNPFDRDFTIVVNSDVQSIAEVAVYDMAGNPLMLEKLQTNIPYQAGDKWKEGVYIIRIVLDGNITHRRVVKGRP